MAYVTSEAQQEMLDDIADAIEDLGAAVAALGGAYEQLDEQTGDRLEEELFRPAQAALGRAKRTHTGFAERTGLVARPAPPANAGHPSQGVKGFVEAATEAAERADHTLAELQDSMRPVDVGDAELRAGLAEVRELIGHTRGRAREFVRVLGR